MDNVLIGKFPPFPYWRIGELQSTDYGRGERVEQYIYFFSSWKQTKGMYNYGILFAIVYKIDISHFNK